MYPTSAGFKTALIESHQIVTRAEVLDDNLVVAILDIHDGQVVADANQAIRRRANVTLTDATGTMTPSDATSLLSPITGNELRLSRGISLAASDEFVPLGIFRISSCEIVDTPTGLKIQIDAYDRARRVSRAKYTDNLTIAAGVNYADAIHDVIDARVAGLNYSFTPTTYTTPLIVLEAGDDPWEKARAMAAALGCELFFDVAGTVVMRPVPDPATAPVEWVYAEGADATILSAQRRLVDEHTFNWAVVTGESSTATAPVRGESFDNDPSSPTYTGGSYGIVPIFEKSTLITTAPQASAAAAALLLNSLGATEDVSFNAIVNPAHEPGDVIEITRERAHIAARYVIDALTIPMRAEQSMSASTRRRYG